MKRAAVFLCGLLVCLGALWAAPVAAADEGRAKAAGSRAFDQALTGNVQAENRLLSLKSAEYAKYAYKESEVVKKLRRELGFELIVNGYRNAAGADRVAYTISRRTIQRDDRTYNLYAVVIRGTKGGEEWLSNCRVGRGNDHQGFAAAMERVKSDLLEAARTPVETNRLWIAGHSRGAAVANLLAAKMSGSDAFAADAVFAYAFATPNVTCAPRASVSVHNYILLEDIVPDIPPERWNMGRHGTNHYASVKDVAGLAKAYKKETRKKFKPISLEKKRETVALLSQLSRDRLAWAVERYEAEVIVKPADPFTLLKGILSIYNRPYAAGKAGSPKGALDQTGKEAFAAHEMICYLTWMRKRVQCRSAAS
ncbi:hypothetical protein ACH6CV_01340 [Bacillota bacterium Meth-B3]